MRSKSGIMSLDLQLIASDSYQVNVEQNLALLLAVRIICLLLVSPSQVLYLFKASWSQMRGSCFIPDFTVSVCLTSDSVGSHSEPCSSSQQVHTDIYMKCLNRCKILWFGLSGVRIQQIWWFNWFFSWFQCAFKQTDSSYFLQHTLIMVSANSLNYLN